MAPIDPHSYTDSTHPLTTHISLSFYFDFASSTILSSAVLSLAAPYSGAFTLDSRSLSISEVLDLATLTPSPSLCSPLLPTPFWDNHSRSPCPTNPSCWSSSKLPPPPPPSSGFPLLKRLISLSPLFTPNVRPFTPGLFSPAKTPRLPGSNMPRN
ncbi:UNVERIFIED_CONTAM: Leucine aminopeptidase [Sesamum latifolium]|uniref:Leucine aminopeptidase n=1 Tax=Sesamum latifolium TaxID=2727402 RepID=A0AAW2XJX9_9LAMI